MNWKEIVQYAAWGYQIADALINAVRAMGVSEADIQEEIKKAREERQKLIDAARKEEWQ